MSDSNESKRAIDGRDVALVILTLGGVGGYLWLDHKLRIEQKTNAELSERLMQLAANQLPGAPPAKPAAARVVLPPGAVPQALMSQMASGMQALPAAGAAASTPRRNAPSLARVPRIELAPRTYDEVFDRYGRGLPVAYLRALALHESDMRPRLADGPSWGLLQVIEVVREDFNRRERANFTRADLLDPAINVMIAASAIALIVKSYAAHHPGTPNLQPDWRNPQFVALVTFGWNAGWSERGGVGRVASFLEQRGADVAINSVFDAAKAAGASPHLSNPMKLAFAKQVTRQYFAELADEERVIEIETPVARAPSDRPAVVVDVGSSPPASSAAPVEMPVIVVESPPAPSVGPEYSPGPITSPSQLEHDVAPPVPAPAPIVAPPVAAPAMPAYPSGGSGPIDPYGEPVPPIEHYGYPEDPYAYSYSPGAAPHA